jgi:predicted AAA+ superfamily ATPase
LRLIASQAANLYVPASIGRRMNLDQRTVESYVGLLETIYLVKRIPAWRPGLGLREIQHPKIYAVDSALLLHLLGANEKRFLDDDQMTGKVLENFLAMEVIKHTEWSEQGPRVHHYRRKNDEVDLVIENRSGEIVAIEVKSHATVREADWRVMAKLREKRGDDFRCGAIFYTGAQTIPLGDRLFALPLSAVWS